MTEYKKIIDLPQIDNLSDEDVFEVTDDPTGSAVSKKVTGRQKKTWLKEYFDTLYNNFDFPDTLKIVQENQTIQEIIDSCPSAEGNLKDGFTNPYVVRVPPGHEKEFYSLVRNAADEASDKRNVKVIFEDNPEGMFQTELFDNCESLDGWSVLGGTMEIDTGYRFDKEACIKLTSGTQTTVILQKTDLSLDLRKYQGIILTLDINPEDFSGVILYALDSTGKYSYYYSKAYITGINTVCLFFAKTTDSEYPDMSNITTFRLRIFSSSESNNVYIGNIQFFRTTQTPVALLRFDDGTYDHFKYLSEIESRGWKGAFGLILKHINENNYLSVSDIKKMHKLGHSLVNHSFSHPQPFNEITNSQAHYEVMTNYRWQILLGLKRTFPFFFPPGGAAHPEAERCIQRQGGMNMYPQANAFPCSITGVSSPDFSTEGLERFITSRRGGICQIMIHTIPDANIDAYRNFLDYVETHFSMVIPLDQIPKLFPSDWPIKFEPSFYIFDGGQTKTLTEDITISLYEGNSFSFDPGGSARNVIPITNKGISYEIGNQITIINTADAAETLTFDPSFITNGTHDGDAEASDLTDSSASWIVGQLVGRTITNTTDGSSGIIVSNTSDTIVGKLTGGTNNTWAVGDSYTITPGGLNQDIAQNERGTFVYDGEGWVKIQVG